MKKFSSLKKGFTLVELMIVIAIIGILAAVLYPAMTGYFERSRDTNRQGALRNVSLALAQYSVDNEHFPKSGQNGCLSDIEDKLKPTSGGQTYIKTIPTDPKKFTLGSCAAWVYAYKETKDTPLEVDKPTAASVAARVEIKGNATMNKATWDANFTAAEWILLVPKSNTHSSLSGENTKENWYLTMTQE